jgi:ATPase subunit of ABC transporter with duplicated ATPase domains
VRYPYPKTLFSNYRQNYHGKLAQTEVKPHKQAFNLEKESKIINPHKMDLATTNKTKFRGEKGDRAARKVEEIVEPPRPIQQTSSYKASFPDWDNGKNDVFHEKHPQYPYYSLPFNGGSTYKNNFTKR